MVGVVVRGGGGRGGQRVVTAGRWRPRSGAYRVWRAFCAVWGERLSCVKTRGGAGGGGLVGGLFPRGAPWGGGRARGVWFLQDALVMVVAYAEEVGHPRGDGGGGLEEEPDDQGQLLGVGRRVPLTGVGRIFVAATHRLLCLLGLERYREGRAGWKPGLGGCWPTCLLRT